MNRLAERTGGGSLLLLIDEAYERRSWHGTNLRGSIRGLTCEQAGWRPPGGRYCIAEIVVHCAYWKYAVGRRVRGGPRGSFPIKGSNWFPVAGPLTPAVWREFVALLESQHRALRAAVAELAPNRLTESATSGKMSIPALLRGIALHDIYHAGQIQLIKGMWKRRSGT